MNKRENDLSCKSVVDVDSKRAQIILNKPGGDAAHMKNFTFDGTYGVDSNTASIYDDIAYNLVEGVIEGYNGTVFAYGQTGCGKSFTMQGIPSQRGLIPRSFQHIFESISVAENTKFLVRASYLEIYNEEIRDLLAVNSKQKLDLKENPDRGVYVKSLSHHQVSSVTECEKLMEKGWSNRATGETLMNKDSSRSHSIFTIYVEAAEKDDSAGGDEEKIRAGKLNLVDLAGSERQSKTGATGARLKEATKINLSLSALGNVISALVDGKSKHIPYRDSKLTRLLQDSLGGNTKTLMVACVSPADNNYDETLSTLRYANRAKNIQNKPKINEDPKDALLRQYQDEIKKLKDMLEGKSVQPSQTSVELDFDLEEEREKIRAELRKEFEEQIKSTSHKQVVQSAQPGKTRKDPIGQNNAVMPNEVIQGQEPSEPKLSSDSETSLAIAANEIDTANAIQKLQAKLLVGGENLNNEEVKERKKKRKKHADKKRNEIKRMAEADDDMLMNVYEDINDELRNQTIQVERYKHKLKNYKMEIQDLNEEFENQRQSYHADLRDQQLQIDLLTAILDRIQPTIRRDCNYYNLDKIKDESEHNGEFWVLPKLRIIKESLPNLSSSPSDIEPGYRSHQNGYNSPGRQMSEQRLLSRKTSHERLDSRPIEAHSDFEHAPKPRPFKLGPLRPLK